MANRIMANRIEKYVTKGIIGVANDAHVSCKRNIGCLQFSLAIEDFNFLKAVYKDMLSYAELGFEFDAGRLGFTEERIGKLEEDLKKVGVDL